MPASEIVEVLHLNDPEYVLRRGRMIELFRELERRRPDLCHVWLGFPDDLPNLESLRPPGGDTRPDGIEQSHFRRRERGELPATY